MKPIGLETALKELRSLLKQALQHCESLPNVTEELQAAVRSHSLSCFGLEQIIEAVGKSSKLHRSALQDRKLIKCHLQTAQQCLEQIQHTTLQFTHPHLLYCVGRRRVRREDVPRFMLSKLTKIAAAIQSTVLLVSIRVDETICNGLTEKLYSLIQSNPEYESDSDSTSVKTLTQADNYVRLYVSSQCTYTRLRRLLEPATVAFIYSELRQAECYAEQLSCGVPVLTNSGQLLDVNLLGWLLGSQPSHPPYIEPQLVSYKSDIVVAAETGDEDRLSRVLRSHPNLRYSFTIAGLTPIFFAVYSGRIAAVDCLLRHGVSVNDSFGKARTVPLGAALQFRNLCMARHLINVGADLSYRNIDGWSLLFYIWFKPQRNIPASAILTLLYARPEFGSFHKDVYDKNGWHVMHWALINGAPEDLSLLIDYGVDPFVTTRAKSNGRLNDQDFDYSVLQLGVLYGLTKSVELLLPHYLRRFGNVDLANEEKWTLLHMAIDQQHIEITRILIHQRANLMAITKPTRSKIPGHTREYRYTPLSLAKEAGPEFYKEFFYCVRERAQILPVPPQIHLKRKFHAQKFVTKHARKDHCKDYGSTSVSGNGSAHLGDNVRNFHIRNLYLGSTSSLVASKRWRRQVARRLKR